MLNLFSRKIVYPAFWKFRRLRVGEKIPDYIQKQWIPRDQLLERQWAALKRLLSHAYENVPYYSRKMKEAGCHPEDIKSMDDFAGLPFLTKDDIINNQQDLIGRNYRKRHLTEDSTGGSTGKKIIFYEDRNELAHRFASAVRCDCWADLNPGDRFVQIWGSPLDLGKGHTLRRHLDRLFLRRLFISSFDMAEETLERCLEQIKKFRPKVLIGYPTPLHRFALFLKERRSGPLGIKSIISSAETLFDHQREDIETHIGAPVFNRYGCREFGPIAAECEEHRGLHIQSDRLLVELVPTENEEDGLHEIVVTDLYKYAMPFIRYRIGDLAVRFGKECPCGRGLPLLERIEGRTFDMVICSNGNMISGTFWTLLFRSIPGIRMFRVHQVRKERIKITLEVDDEFNPGGLKILAARIHEKSGHGMKIDFDLVSRILPGESGKHRFVLSDVARDYFSL